MFGGATLLEKLRRRGAQGDYVLTNEAIERARLAGHSPADVRHALTRASRCVPGLEGRWTVHGTSLDGTEMTVVILVTGGGGDVTVV